MRDPLQQTRRRPTFDERWGISPKISPHASAHKKETLGAEGVLPGRQIESLLRVCNQFAPTLPIG